MNNPPFSLSEGIYLEDIDSLLSWNADVSEVIKEIPPKFMANKGSYFLICWSGVIWNGMGCQIAFTTPNADGLDCPLNRLLITPSGLQNCIHYTSCRDYLVERLGSYSSEEIKGDWMPGETEGECVWEFADGVTIKFWNYFWVGGGIHAFLK